jgi:hypothetical protein
MTRFLVIIGLILLPLIGSSFEKLSPVEQIAATVDSYISQSNTITIDQKYYNEPPIDHLSILNNSESGYQTPPENSSFHHTHSCTSNVAYSNKILYSVFIQKASENWGSSKKRFIKLQVFRL